MVTMLKRALPALAVTALLGSAPAAMASTATSGNPLTLDGQAAVFQDWTFDDSAAPGTVTATLAGDPVVYDDQDPLPGTCTDFDSGVGDTSTPGADTSASGAGDGTAHILRCTGVTRVVANVGNVGSDIDGRGLTATPLTFNGGDGDDSAYGSEVGDVLGGGAGSDSLRGQVGDDTVNGGAGDDSPVVGGPGVDTVDGGAGNDSIKGGPDADTINGGDGSDSIYGDCNYCESDDEYGNDAIDGGDGADYIDGEGGDDTIDAGAGDDYAYGGNGDDVIHGGAGDDGLSQAQTCAGCGYENGLYGGDGTDKIFGDDGNDTADGGLGDDEIHGGAGDDGYNPEFDLIFLPRGQGAIPFFSQIGLVGGDGNDTISGDDGVDVIRGDYGADTIDGGGQSDYVFEYEDNYGDPANDTVVGGPGQDSVQWSGCSYTEDGGASLSFTLDGQANDGLSYADYPDNSDDKNNYDVENVDLNDQFAFFPFFGCQGDAPAKLAGDADANVLSGGHGSDTIDGGAGPDRLEGEAGDDTFTSRDGYPDYVDCGDGADSVVADNFDSLEACENTDVAEMRSAYDKDEPPVVPAPVVFPVVSLPGDHIGPNTKLTTDTTITLAQLLNGVKLGVECVDEPCTIEGRLLSRELVGKTASSSALRGFNTVLGRKSAGSKAGKRTITVRPCVKKSKRSAAACRERLRTAWANKKSVTVKVQVTTRDKSGNRTRKTKLVKVSVPKAKKAAR